MTSSISVISGAYDWVKNCSSIADFYQSMEKPRHCALALSSANKILNEEVFAKIRLSTTPEEFSVTEQDGMELEAEINKKWARLDVKVLKSAFDIEMAKRHALESGEAWKDPIVVEEEGDCAHAECSPPVPVATTEIGPKDDLVLEDVLDADSCTVTTPTLSATSPRPVQTSLTLSRPLQSSIFSGCLVNDTPFLRYGEVTSFETARIIFLRANARIEDAKKKYVLDGKCLCPYCLKYFILIICVTLIETTHVTSRPVT